MSVEVREEYKHEISVSERALGSFVHQKKASISKYIIPHGTGLSG